MFCKAFQELSIGIRKVQNALEAAATFEPNATRPFNERQLRVSFSRFAAERFVQSFSTQKTICRALHELSIGIK